MGSSQSEALREVNALVAAFDIREHGSIDQSASWLASLSLPRALTANAAHPSRIRIDVSQLPVGNTYESVGAFVDSAFGGEGPLRHQLVLYLDVSSSGRGYRLQRRARKSGYNRRDFQDCLPSQRAQDLINAAPEVLETTVWLNDVLPRWQGDAPIATLHIIRSADESTEYGLSATQSAYDMLSQIKDVKVSDDGDHFLSEYALYRTLALLHLQNNKDMDWHHRTAIASLHLPALRDSEEDMSQARDMVIALIYALIDSRRQRDGDHDDDDPNTSDPLN